MPKTYTAATPLRFIELARSFSKLGEYDKATSIYQNALKLFGNNGLLIKSFSNFLLDINDYEKLIELTDQAYFSSNKRTAIISGNCQAPPLADMLGMHTGFNAEYDIIETLPAIHLMPPELQNIVANDLLPKIDLFITQNILNKNFPLRTEAIASIAKNTIVFPTFYFSAYFPDLIYLKHNGATIRDEPLSDYHSALVVSFFVKRKSAEECASALKSGNWIGNRYEQATLELFETLHEREKSWDVKVIDQIQKAYKKKLLFHTINHPDESLLHYTANSILGMLEMKSLGQDIIDKTSTAMSSTKWIINDWILSGLPKGQGSHDTFLINNNNISIHDFVLLHYNYYAKNIHIVKSNLDSCVTALAKWQN